MLSINDFLKLQKMITDTFDEKLKQFYDEHIKYLPTKDEFFTRMDKNSGELEKIREAQTLHDGQHDRIDRRLDRAEKKLNLTSLAD